MNERLEKLWEDVMQKSIELYLQKCDLQYQLQLAPAELKDKITKKNEKTMNVLSEEWNEIKEKIISTIKEENNDIQKTK